ncbi:MAG: T9SS type A sorting domain-containing protein, partial [Bacteroidota bacterium]
WDAERWVPGAPRAGGGITAVPTYLASRVRAQLLPNPTAGLTSLRFSLTRSGFLDWAVYDANGRRWKDGRRVTTTGLQEVALDLRQLPSGIYFLHGSVSEESIRQRLVISR